MSVQTVLGKIECDCLGIVLSHEHVVLDRSLAASEPEEDETKELFYSKVTIDKLGRLKRNPLAIRDNLIISDENTQYNELMHFKNAGGKTLVDVTTTGLGRNPELLRRMAEKTGLNIIAGAGYYMEPFIPETILDYSIDELKKEIIKQLREGIDDTGVKAGVIGEIGFNLSSRYFEKNSLSASCRAQVETGAPLSIHVNPWAPAAYEAMEIINDHGVEPEKVVICHLDAKDDIDFLVGLLDKGIFIEFDDFGREVTRDLIHCRPGLGRFLTDWEMLRLLKRLIDRGYVKQILLSMDMCLKHVLRAYGGWGYDHILTNLVPMMLELEITQAQIDAMLIHNPTRWLDVQ